MSDCYTNLFIAIWLQAINDDIRSPASKLYDYAFNSVYETYSLNTTNPIDENDKKLKSIKKSIHNHSMELTTDRLMPRIRELVHKEANEWPYNHSYTHNDAEYNLIFNKLKAEILDFAQNEMKSLV